MDAVSITERDIRRLHPDGWLNDNLIQLGLKYVLCHLKCLNTFEQTELQILVRERAGAGCLTGRANPRV